MKPRHPLAPECAEALVSLAREVAAMRTWDELLEEYEPERQEPESALDATIYRARDIIDTYGLHPTDAGELRELRDLGYAQ